MSSNRGGRSGPIITPEIASVLENYFPNLDIQGVVAEQRQQATPGANDGETVFVDLENGTSNGESGEVQQSNHGHSHEHGAQSSSTSTMKIVWKLLQNSAPFVILLLGKLLYEHRFGILILVGMEGTFYQANSAVKRLVAQRESNRAYSTVCKLSALIAFLVGNIAFTYYVLEQQQLYKCLILQLPNVERVDFWTLIWLVGITDFIIKFMSIILKAVITLLPKCVIPYKKRGKHYMMIEHLCQFYSCLTPIVPWVYFLMDTANGGEWFSIILLILYVIFKANMMWKKGLELQGIWKKFLIDTKYGVFPDRESIDKVGDSCPICQDNFHEPVMLSCKHIFCEDCVSLWFDRERTCPMCRANIVDNPTWRDGTTSNTTQLY